MSKLELLRAQLQEKATLIANQVKEQAEIAKLEATIGLLENPVYQNNLVNIQRQQDSISRLQSKLVECEAVVTAMPIYDSIRKQDKRWNARPVYGFGIEINVLYQLLTGIMYSTRAHKEVMLAQTGLTEALIESTVTAFGNPAYYSLRDNAVVPATPANVKQLQSLLPVIANILDVELPMSSITEANFNAKFEEALQRAERDQAQHTLTQLTVGDVNFTMTE